MRRDNVRGSEPGFDAALAYAVVKYRRAQRVPKKWTRRIDARSRRLVEDDWRRIEKLICGAHDWAWLEATHVPRDFSHLPIADEALFAQLDGGP